MSKFSVQLDSPMQNVRVAKADCRVILSSESASQTEPKADARQDTAAVIAATSQAIEAALKDVMTKLSMQSQTLQSTAANYAVEIVRVFLNSTDEIIEQRLRENVTRVLDQPDAYSEATLFVHSDCHDAIQQWLLDSGSFESIECEVKVTVDDQLSPGDCRVNFGNSGRLASFEEQLKLVSARLKQTVRDQLESPA